METITEKEQLNIYRFYVIVEVGYKRQYTFDQDVVSDVDPKNIKELMQDFTNRFISKLQENFVDGRSKKYRATITYASVRYYGENSVDYSQGEYQIAKSFEVWLPAYVALELSDGGMREFFQQKVEDKVQLSSPEERWIAQKRFNGSLLQRLLGVTDPKDVQRLFNHFKDYKVR